MSGVGAKKSFLIWPSRKETIVYRHYNNYTNCCADLKGNVTLFSYSYHSWIGPIFVLTSLEVVWTQQSSNLQTLRSSQKPYFSTSALLRDPIIIQAISLEKCAIPVRNRSKYDFELFKFEFVLHRIKVWDCSLISQDLPERPPTV